MKRKVLSLLLAGAMAMGMLTGCGGSDAAQESGSVQEETGQEAQEESSSQEAAEGEAQDLTTIRILCNNDYSETQKVKDWEDWPVSEVFIKTLEEMGIRLELECIDSSSLGDVIRTRMASGVDMPDIVVSLWSGITEAEILDWAENDLIYCVSDLLEEYDKDGSVKAFYDKYVPSAWNSNTALDGKLYWFSYLYGPSKRIEQESGTEYTSLGAYTLSVRQDWAEAVGEELQDVYTPEALRDLLKKMNEQDVNGNGVSDEVLNINISGFENGIATAYGLTPYLLGGYYNSDNKVFCNFYHENFPAYIEYMKSLYDCGVYDTIAMADGDSLTSENKASGVYSYTTWPTESGIAGVEGVQYMPVIVEADGDISNGFHMSVDPFEGTTYGQWLIPKSCDKVEAVMRLMDYVYTDEYAVICQLGLEGTGHEIDENGNYVTKWIEGDRDSNSLRGTGLALYALPSIYVYPAVAPIYDEEKDLPYIIPKNIWHYKLCTEYFPNVDYSTGHQLAMASEEEVAVIERTENVLSTYASELLTDLILGNKSLNNLPEYQKEMEELGLLEYLNVMQARRNRILGIE